MAMGVCDTCGQGGLRYVCQRGSEILRQQCSGGKIVRKYQISRCAASRFVCFFPLNRCAAKFLSYFFFHTSGAATTRFCKVDCRLFAARPTVCWLFRMPPLKKKQRCAAILFFFLSFKICTDYSVVRHHLKKAHVCINCYTIFCNLFTFFHLLPFFSHNGNHDSHCCRKRIVF